MTTLLIQVTDNLSGVKSVTGNLRSPSGSAILPFEAQGVSGSSVFAARITIPSEAEAGDWYVAHLLVLDRASYSMMGTFTAATVPPGGTIRVSSQRPDTTAPEVRAVWIEKRALRDGEKNLIRIEVVDDRSGVAEVRGAFQSPSRSALIWFTCRFNAESGSWEGEVAVPVNSDCGEWTLQQLRVMDNASNVAYLSSASWLVANVAFEVLGQGNCDSSPPTLERFDLSPTVVSNETGAEILVSATVRDEGSGATLVSGWVDGPASANQPVSRISFNCAQDPNDPESWTGRILVTRYAAKGTWKVVLVHLADRARNTRDCRANDPVLSEAVFEVE